MTGDRERCLGAGMDAFITKPIDAAQFIATVEALGERSRAAASSAPPAKFEPEPQPAAEPSSLASGV